MRMHWASTVLRSELPGGPGLLSVEYLDVLLIKGFGPVVGHRPLARLREHGVALPETIEKNVVFFCGVQRVVHGFT